VEPAFAGMTRPKDTAMRYSLLLHNIEPGEGDIPPETMAAFQAAYTRYARSLAEAGVLVSADVLQPSAVTTSVRMQDGRLQVQDGPFADTKEQLAGAFVIDVPDLDAALAWAEQCPGVQYGVIEIRPSAIVFRDGAWQPPA
jgi:hypothetical protein